MASELELKLEIAPEETTAFKSVMASLGWSPSSELMLANCYYDTPDQALKQARIAVRVRRAGDQWIQTLKTAGRVDAHGVSHRGEWEWTLPSSELDTGLLRDHLPVSFELSALKAIFTTDFKRTTWLVEYEGSAVEIALDQGEIFAAPKRVPISEVELELKSGEATALLGLADLLKAQVPLRVSTISKAERAQRLLDGES